ncbi:hypothetical protein H4R99_004463 [Coemansia sp. RSA 1722]|nr:hypothetical protein H4R99_004463 [Coemansia sp. RSA 1722]
MLKLTHPPPPTLTFGTVGCYGRSAQDIVESDLLLDIAKAAVCFIGINLSTIALVNRLLGNSVVSVGRALFNRRLAAAETIAIRVLSATPVLCPLIIGFAYSGTLGFDNFSGLIAIGATVSLLLFSGAAAVEMSLTPNAVSPANIAVECQILGPAFVSAARSADATDILTVLGAAVAAPALSTVDCSNICRR